MRLICAGLLAVLVVGRAAPAVDLPGTTALRDKPIANAVVWLEAPLAPATKVEQIVVLDQRNLAFSPRVLAVRVGTTVGFPNNDRVFHDVFSFRDGKKFELGLYPVGTVKHVPFDRPGLSRIFCNIHPAMAAYILAVDTPPDTSTSMVTDCADAGADASRTEASVMRAQTAFMAT